MEKNIKDEMQVLTAMVQEATILFKDPEAILAIMQAYNDVKGDLKPALMVLRDTLGRDADEAVDAIIKWSAKKTFVSYVAYQSAGFTKIEAMQLTLNAREDLVAAIRNAK